MELSDDTLWIDVDHVNVDLPAVWVGIDECRVEVQRVNLDRLALGPFELPLEAVLLNDVGVARKVRDQDKQIQVLVFAGHAPQESVHAPAAHHPALDTVPVEKFVDRLCLLNGHRPIHGRSLHDRSGSMRTQYPHAPLEGGYAPDHAAIRSCRRGAINGSAS